MNEDRQAIDAIAETAIEGLSEGDAQSMLTHVVHQARQVRDVRPALPSDIERAAFVAFVAGNARVQHMLGASMEDLGTLFRDELNIDADAVVTEINRILEQAEGDWDIDDAVKNLVQQVVDGDSRWVKPPLPSMMDVEAACHEAFMAELHKQYAGRLRDEPVPYETRWERLHSHETVRTWVKHNVV